MSKTNHHKIRIIAGKYRGRRVEVAERSGLRPSPSRVRETAFNWLQFIIPGAQVLDVFAGTGIMGLEALSRQASSALFIEQDQQSATAISDTLNQWREKHGRVQIADSLRLAPTNNRYDLIFIDPPFSDNLHQQSLDKFLNDQWLKAHGIVYIEMPFAHDSLTLAPNYQWLKQSKASKVYFGLIQRVSA